VKKRIDQVKANIQSLKNETWITTYRHRGSVWLGV
jgi:hypothetical protein